MVEVREVRLCVGDDFQDGEYYTISEFAELYDVPESSVRTWLNRGQLPCINCYGRTYIPKDAEVNYNWPWMKRLTSLRRSVSQKG